MNIFKELLSQLSSKCEEIIPYCYEKRMASGDITLNSMSLVDVLLKAFVDRLFNVFIIVDGLDECEPVERKVVLATLSTLVDHCDRSVPGKLRLLFISQYFKDIQKLLSGASVIALASDDNKDDIREYVRVFSEKIQEKHELDGEQLEKIREKAWVRSDGMEVPVHVLVLRH